MGQSKYTFTKHALQRYVERFMSGTIHWREAAKLMAKDVYSAIEFKSIVNDTVLQVNMGEKYGYDSRLWIKDNKVFVIDVPTLTVITGWMLYRIFASVIALVGRKLNER